MFVIYLQRQKLGTLFTCNLHKFQTDQQSLAGVIYAELEVKICNFYVLLTKQNGKEASAETEMLLFGDTTMKMARKPVKKQAFAQNNSCVQGVVGIIYNEKKCLIIMYYIYSYSLCILSVLPRHFCTEDIKYANQNIKILAQIKTYSE